MGISVKDGQVKWYKFKIGTLGRAKPGNVMKKLTFINAKHPGHKWGCRVYSKHLSVRLVTWLGNHFPLGQCPHYPFRMHLLLLSFLSLSHLPLYGTCLGICTGFWKIMWGCGSGLVLCTVKEILFVSWICLCFGPEQGLCNCICLVQTLNLHCVT